MKNGMNIYVVNGGVWTNYAWKIFVVSFVGLLIALYDWKKNDRKDYLYVYLIATIYWACAEFMMHLIGIRDQKSQQLFGFELPLYIGVIVQGTSEAAFGAVIALFIADRLAIEETKNVKEGLIGIGIIIGLNSFTLFWYGIQTPNVGGVVGSRRNMMDPFSNLFYITMTIFIVVWLIKGATPELRRRTLYYYLGVILLMTIFTSITVIGGNRWIEIGPEGGPWTRAPLLLELAAHFHFAVVQEWAKFVPFFILPCLFGLIKSSEDI